MEVEAAFYYYLHATEKKKKKVNKTTKLAKQSVFNKCQKSGSSSTLDSLPLSEYVCIYIYADIWKDQSWLMAYWMQLVFFNV